MIDNTTEDYIEEDTTEDSYFIEDEIPEEFKEDEKELDVEPKQYSKYVKGKKYFDEKYVVSLIHEWQASVYILNGVVMQRDVVVENKIMKEIDKIGLAIINQYRYHIFEPIDDLMQEATKECWRNLPKFSTDKGTSFNYFSLICKRHLLNYTTRRSKHRNLNDVDEQVDLESRRDINYDLFFDDLETTLNRLINENFLKIKRKKYLVIAAVMLDYLRKTRKYVSKTDFYSWARSWGLKTSEVREFITEMSSFKEDIFSVSK